MAGWKFTQKIPQLLKVIMCLHYLISHLLTIHAYQIKCLFPFSWKYGNQKFQTLSWWTVIFPYYTELVFGIFTSNNGVTEQRDRSLPNLRNSMVIWINIARIPNAVQVTLWLSVTNLKCHDYSFSICQELSTVSLSHWIAPNVFVFVFVRVIVF